MIQTHTNEPAGAIDEDIDESIHLKSIVVIPRHDVVKSIACPICYSVLEDWIADDFCFAESKSKRACCHNCVERLTQKLIDDAGMVCALGAIFEPLTNYIKQLERRPDIDPQAIQEIVNEQAPMLADYAAAAPSFIHTAREKIERRMKERKL